MTAPSESELDLLVELRDRIEDLGLDEEYLQPKNLVRFLRARGCNLSKAEEMIRKNIEWLEEYDVKNVMDYEPLPGWETGICGPITGFDKEGGPVILLPIGQWDPSLISGLMDDYVRWGVKMFETVWAVIQTKSKGKDSMNQFSIIVDLKGLGWKHYTNYAALYGTMTLVKFFEANYPETLRVAFMINAPSMFGMFWKLIKPLVSAATHEKLQFLPADKSNWKSAIVPYVNEDQFWESYGGTLPDNTQLTLNEISGGNRSFSKNGNSNE